MFITPVLSSYLRFSALVCCFFVLFAALPTYAQRMVFVAGSVVDSTDNNPLPGCRLTFRHAGDSTKTTQTQTDAEGKFRHQVPAGRYWLYVKMDGYLPYKRYLELKAGSARELTIALQEDNRQLEGVEVSGNLAPAVQKGDTTEFNAGAFKTNPDATSEDLVRKMPGITVDNGTVKANGEEVKRVTVDGQEFFGDDAVSALRNLPAEVVDKVQVFDRMSDQAQMTGFDDGRTSKALNIITRSDKRMGRFGRAYAGAGTDDRYQAGGVLNEFQGKRRITVIGMSNNINQQNFSSQDMLGVTSGGGGMGRGGPGSMRGAMGRGGFMLGAGVNQGGMMGGMGATDFNVAPQKGISETHALGINYSDKWKDKYFLTASWFTNATHNNNVLDVTRNYFLTENSGQQYNSLSNSSSRNENHRFQARFEYKPDTTRWLLLTPKFSYQNYQGANTQTSANLFEARELNRTANQTQTQSNGFNFSNDLLYRHGFAKKNRVLTFIVGTQVADNNADTKLDARNSFIRPMDTLPTFVNFAQKQRTDATNYTLSTAVFYSEPISEKSVLQADYAVSYTNSASDRRTRGLDSLTQDFTRLDTLLTNTFENGNLGNRGTLSYRYRNDKLTFMTGASYQNVRLTGDQTFPAPLNLSKTFESVLPHLVIRYDISKRSMFRLFYRTYNSQPTVNQLQTVVDNANPLILSTGNFNLRQDYTNMVMVRYTYVEPEKGLSLSVMANASQTQDYIGNETIIAQNDTVLAGDGLVLRRGAQLSRPINIDGYRSGRSSLSLGFPYRALKMNLNFTTTVTLTQSPGLINGQKNISSAAGLSQGVVVSSNISEKIDYLVLYSFTYSDVQNTLQPQLNNRFTIQTAFARINLLLPKGFTFQNDVSWNGYAGLADGFNLNYTLWNVGVGKKFFPSQSVEVRFTVFDLLNRNNNISRSSTESYIEDQTTAVLRRYYMLSLNWKFNQFRKPAEKQ